MMRKSKTDVLKCTRESSKQSESTHDDIDIDHPPLRASPGECHLPAHPACKDGQREDPNEKGR